MPSGPVLNPRGGGGGGRGWDQWFWLWPLPSPGRLTFVCEWPLQEIGEPRVETGAAAPMEAANDAIALWPDERPEWEPQASPEVG